MRCRRQWETDRDPDGLCVIALDGAYGVCHVSRASPRHRVDTKRAAVVATAATHTAAAAAAAMCVLLLLLLLLPRVHEVALDRRNNSEEVNLESSSRQSMSSAPASSCLQVNCRTDGLERTLQSLHPGPPACSYCLLSSCAWCRTSSSKSSTPSPLES